MKTAVSLVRHDDFDIRDAARREARRDGVSLGQWLDGVMAERAGALGLKLADLDPRQRIAAIVTRLNRSRMTSEEEAAPSIAVAAALPFGEEETVPVMPVVAAPDQPPVASETLEHAPPSGASGMPPTDPDPENERRPAKSIARVDPAPLAAAAPVATPSPITPTALRGEALAGVSQRQAAQRVEIETKLHALFAALDRTPRRTHHVATAVEADEEEQDAVVLRKRTLLGETTIGASWRLEKAVAEITERQAFLERQPPEIDVSAPQPFARPARARPTTDDLSSPLGTAQAAPTPAQAAPAPVPVAFAPVIDILPGIVTGLQSDVTRLSQRLEAVRIDASNQLAVARDEMLGEVQALLDRMRPDASIDKLGHQVEALAAKLGSAVNNSVSPAALGELSQRIEEVHADLAARLAGETAAPALDMAAIERLIRDVVAQSDRTSQPIAMLRSLETTVCDLAEKMHNAERLQGDGAVLAELQNQIGTLAARVDRSDAGLNSIVTLERSMSNILTQLGGMRTAALETAETTARTTAEATVRAVMAQPDLAPAPSAAAGTVALQQVTADVARLRADREETDKRLHGLLVTLNGSLERVVDRLTALEEGAGLPAPHAESSAAAVEPVVTIDWPESRVSAELMELDTPIAPNTGDRAGFSDEGAVIDPAALAIETPRDPMVFIAAARRAAQSATQEQALRMDDGVGRERMVSPAEQTSLKASLSSKRRPLLLALAGVVLLIGIAQVVRITLSDSDTAASAPTSGAVSPTLRSDPSPTPAPVPGPKSDAAPAGGDAVTGEAARPAVATPEGLPVATPAPAGNGKVSQAAPPPAPAADDLLAATNPVPDNKALPTLAMGPGASIAALQANEAAARVAATGGIGAGLRALADGGAPDAQFEVGLRYAEGRGVARDLPMAAEWFEKAAQQGLAPAAYRLGSLYEKGLGVARDPVQSMAWYQKAATAGNIRAMHNLAVMLAEGAAAKADYAAAAVWFTKAAAAGVRDSQFNLAILYARGLGVEQSLTQSYIWFALAAAQGDTDSVKKRDEVAGHLDPQALEDAKAATAGFVPTTAVAAANDVPVPAGGWDAPAPHAAAGKPASNAHVSGL